MKNFLYVIAFLLIIVGVVLFKAAIIYLVFHFLYKETGLGIDITFGGAIVIFIAWSFLKSIVKEITNTIKNL